MLKLEMFLEKNLNENNNLIVVFDINNNGYINKKIVGKKFKQNNKCK